jgi:hypothetical protein
MLRLVPSDYGGFAGENGILGKYTGVDDFVRSGKEALYMPKAGTRSPAGYAGNKIAYILDGRHRFAWMRDHGAQALPVSAPADEALEIAKLVRTELRVCRVTRRRRRHCGLCTISVSTGTQGGTTSTCRCHRPDHHRNIQSRADSGSRLAFTYKKFSEDDKETLGEY